MARAKKKRKTKTQVLNISDLEETVRKEKKTSKRPAIFLTILGVFCLLIGTNYGNILKLVIKEITPPKPQISRRITEKTYINEMKTTIKSCNYYELAREDGIDLRLTTTLNFYDEKLVSYTKNATYTASKGKEELGLTNLPKSLSFYQNLDTITIIGYDINTEEIENGFNTKVIVDLKTLDPTKLTTNHQANIVSKVDFKLNDNIDTTLAKAKTYGYICNE